jgi:hypothetical protein
MKTRQRFEPSNYRWKHYRYTNLIVPIQRPLAGACLVVQLHKTSKLSTRRRCIRSVSKELMRFASCVMIVSVLLACLKRIREESFSFVH